MHMLITSCFSFVNLSLASLIYRTPAGETKMRRRKDFPSPTTSSFSFCAQTMDESLLNLGSIHAGPLPVSLYFFLFDKA